MNHKYQLIILGNKEPFAERVISLLLKRVNELRLSKDNFRIIYTENFQELKKNEPCYCIYFGDVSAKEEGIDELKFLQNEAIPILPVVNDLKAVATILPNILHQINAIEIKKEDDCQQIVARVLESFSLLRKTRKIFISYKRDESSSIALQLFEIFEKHGFDVFLDTHSVPPAEKFQEELFHRMTDCDVVLMLYTKNFFSSKWTNEEFDKANSMSIGITQLIWPDVETEAKTKLFVPMNLKISDFCDTNCSKLKDSKLQQIVNSVESIRARSLSARRSSILTEFVKALNNLKIDYVQQPNGLIVLENLKKIKKVLVISTVGIPQSLNYNNSRKYIESSDFSDVYLLYDHTYIKNNWLDYLVWLDKHLPVKTIKISEVENWLK